MHRHVNAQQSLSAFCDTVNQTPVIKEKYKHVAILTQCLLCVDFIYQHYSTSILLLNKLRA